MCTNCLKTMYPCDLYALTLTDGITSYLCPSCYEKISDCLKAINRISQQAAILRE